MTDGLTEAQRAFLAAREHQDVLSHFSARELDALDMDEFARLTGRPTHAESAVTALDARYNASAPHVPQQAPAPVQEAQQPPQGIDVSQLSMGQYAQLRAQLGVTGREYGRGALDGGSTADWVQAAQRKAGRSGWQRGNVTESPRLTNRYINHDEQRDNRTAAQRFSNQANAFGL